MPGQNDAPISSKYSSRYVPPSAERLATMTIVRSGWEYRAVEMLRERFRVEKAAQGSRCDVDHAWFVHDAYGGKVG